MFNISLSHMCNYIKVADRNYGLQRRRQRRDKICLKVHLWRASLGLYFSITEEGIVVRHEWVVNPQQSKICLSIHVDVDFIINIMYCRTHHFPIMLLRSCSRSVTTATSSANLSFYSFFMYFYSYFHIFSDFIQWITRVDIKNYSRQSTSLSNFS